MWQLALLLPILLLLLTLAMNAWHAYLIYRDVDKRTPRDVSSERRPMPAEIAEWGRQLRELGFERLGEVEVSVPSVGVIVAVIKRRQQHTAWLFRDRAATTVAEATRELLDLSSRLADGSYVLTMRAVGNRIDEPGLFVSVVPGGPRDTYRHHLINVETRAVSHGPPGTVSSMAQQAAQDAEFRASYAKRQLRRPLVIRWLLPIAVIALALVVLTILTIWLVATVVGR